MEESEAAIRYKAADPCLAAPELFNDPAQKSSYAAA